MYKISIIKPLASSTLQPKAATEVVVDLGHTETQTLETDYFSVYFYDNYERLHKDHTHHLKQKVSTV